MACWTQQEIADEVGLTQETVKEVLKKSADLPKPFKPTADHLTDFKVPLYNVWKFGEKTNQIGHFGNTEQTIVDNLLYLYTDPFDIVIDPFAGGGSTIASFTKIGSPAKCCETKSLKQFGRSAKMFQTATFDQFGRPSVLTKTARLPFPLKLPL